MESVDLAKENGKLIDYGSLGYVVEAALEDTENKASVFKAIKIESDEVVKKVQIEIHALELLDKI